MPVKVQPIKTNANHQFYISCAIRFLKIIQQPLKYRDPPPNHYSFVSIGLTFTYYCIVIIMTVSLEFYNQLKHKFKQFFL